MKPVPYKEIFAVVMETDSSKINLLLGDKKINMVERPCKQPNKPMIDIALNP